MRRFTETTKWADPWFQDLPNDMKLLWLYLCDHCDNAGLWHVNKRLAEFYLGTQFDWDSVLNHLGIRVEVITPDRWWIPSFIGFQINADLSPACKPHQQIIRLLEKYGLTEHYKQGTTSPAPAPISTDDTQPSEAPPRSTPPVVPTKKTEETDGRKDLDPKLQQNIDILFERGCEFFAEAGHKIPTTPDKIAKAKDVLRLMLTVDELDPYDVDYAMIYVNQSTGNGDGGFPGWRVVCQSFAGLRNKWPKIWPQAAQRRDGAYPTPQEDDEDREEYLP